MVRITESTTIYLHWANKVAVSGGTLTIFNDSGGGGRFAGWRRAGEERNQRAGRKLQGKFRGGEDKRGL